MMTRTKRHKRQPGVVCLDLRPLMEAFTKAGEALRRLGRSVHPRMRARHALGGAGDPWDLHGWQSGPCSGWLHDSCPNTPVVQCACTCHGGPLR